MVIFKNFIKTIRNIANKLSSLYDARECNAIARYIVEEISCLSYTDILVKDTKFSEVDREKIEEITKRLLDGEPLQYVLGYSYFCDLKICVNNNVLIPRPETAELVEWILQTANHYQPLRLADIGTGSGCIAIALKHACPLWHVTGIDISQEALIVAQENAQRNQAKISRTLKRKT